MKKINKTTSLICPSCHKRINPFIGMCICGYEIPNRPKLRALRSYRPKKLSFNEYANLMRKLYGEDAYSKIMKVNQDYLNKNIEK